MNLILERGTIKKLSELPPYSIALDGFVQGPEIDLQNHRISLDHHSGVLRFCTEATCKQAWTMIRLGIEDLDQYTIYINDADVDTCLAVWCLQNPDRCIEPLVKKLIDAVCQGDMHCGGIPLNGMEKYVEYISGPETDSKRKQDYHKLSNEGLLSIMEAIMHRIDNYLEGHADEELHKRTKHGEFKILRNENGWLLAESNDPHALGAIFRAGFDRALLIRKQDDGTIAATLAKKSDFVDHFPLEKIYFALSALEPGKGTWGGGTTVGGPPRYSDGKRSEIQLEKTISVIDEIVLQSYAKKT